jgi:tripartite-type tricarboxylate transporter receptor subunit TctC
MKKIGELILKNFSKRSIFNFFFPPNKKKVLKKLLSFGFLCLLPLQLPAQEYPNRSVKVIVTFTAGGGADFMGRVISQKLSEIFQQPFVVDNKTGASGVIGVQFVTQSKPDGYTLLLGTTGTHSTNYATIPNIPYHPVKDMTTIAIFSDAPYLVCINPKLGITSMKELAEYSKKNPGKLTYGSSGVGSSPHLGFEAMKSAVGIDATHIPYKGLPSAMADVISGQISMTYDSIASAVPFMKAGRVNCVAVGSKERSPILPNMPTIAEASGTNFTMGSWYGLFAPKDLPDAITQKLSDAILQILKSPDFQNTLANVGAIGLPMNPSQAKTYLEADVDRWVQIAKNLKLNNQQ